jgi:dUTP pyrophosphatase
MKTKTILLRNAKEIYNGKFYATANSAGFDLRYVGIEPLVIPAGENKLVPTGLKMEIPEGFYLAIHPRSGLSAKYNITLGNAVGVVDSDFRGEIQAIIYHPMNFIKDNGWIMGLVDSFVINPGDRIAQALLMKHEKVRFDFVDEINETERGEGGFGSTGTN